MSEQDVAITEWCSSALQQFAVAAHSNCYLEYYRTMLQQQLAAGPNVPVHCSCTAAGAVVGAVAAAAMWELPGVFPS